MSGPEHIHIDDLADETTKFRICVSEWCGLLKRAGLDGRYLQELDDLARHHLESCDPVARQNAMVLERRLEKLRDELTTLAGVGDDLSRWPHTTAGAGISNEILCARDAAVYLRARSSER